MSFIYKTSIWTWLSCFTSIIYTLGTAREHVGAPQRADDVPSSRGCRRRDRGIKKLQHLQWRSTKSTEYSVCHEMLYNKKIWASGLLLKHRCNHSSQAALVAKSRGHHLEVLVSLSGLNLALSKCDIHLAYYLYWHKTRIEKTTICRWTARNTRGSTKSYRQIESSGSTVLGTDAKVVKLQQWLLPIARSPWSWNWDMKWTHDIWPERWS